MDVMGTKQSDACVVLASRCEATRSMLGALLAAADPPARTVGAPGEHDALVAARHAGLVLLDARDTSGPRELARRIAALRCTAGSPEVVVLSDAADPATVRAALQAGAVSFLLTWADARQLHATLAAALDRRGVVDTAVVLPVVDLCARVVEQARDRDRAVIESLAQAVGAKDVVTGDHLHAVSGLAHQLAGQVDPAIIASDDFRFGCLLHDVGKIGVPDAILLKPARLDPEEYEIIKRHPCLSAEIVNDVLTAEQVSWVLGHHERFDGHGYPDRLTSNRIPIGARVLAVADAWDVMISERSYSRALSREDALGEMRAQAGRQFCPDMVGALIAVVTDKDAAGLPATSGPLSR